MNIELYKLIITVLIAIGGWYAGHYYTWKREQQKKERDLKLKYLQGAYKDLTRLRSYAAILTIHEVAALVVGVVSDIDLFGTEEQIKLADELCKQLTTEEGRFSKSSELIKNLRDDLRLDLDLNPTDTIGFFKFKEQHIPTGIEYKVHTTGEIIQVNIPPLKKENLSQTAVKSFGC